jgi:hypothetical protein
MTPAIVCPTHGRAGRVKVRELIPGIPLVVAESQEPAYRAAYPDDELVVHPDSVKGIAPKRQWIYERYGDVMMFDDDVSAMFDNSAVPGEDPKVRDPQRIRDQVEGLFELGAGMDAKVLGFNTYTDPALYRPHRPFSLRHMVSGHVLGLRRSEKLRFPDMPYLLTDDLYISALCAFHHRFVLTDMRYGFAVQAWHEPGGMSTQRTWDRVVANEKFLQEQFGDAIVRRQESARSSLTVEIQNTLRLPW